MSDLYQRRKLPMSPRGWATEIMERLRLPTLNWDEYTTQDILTEMVEAIEEEAGNRVEIERLTAELWQEVDEHNKSRAEIGRLRADKADLLAALELPLLFHGAGWWDEEKRAQWVSITGTPMATTKVMCDHIRAAITKAEVGDQMTTCKYPNCDGGNATGYCHVDCRAVIAKGESK